MARPLMRSGSPSPVRFFSVSSTSDRLSKDLGVFFPVQERAGRDRVSFSRLWSLPDLHELTWVIIGKRFQLYCVHHAENGRARPDAQREREHRHGGEAGIL